MGSHNRIDYKAIGKRLAEVRGQQNISQAELAERAGITKVYLSNMENAHSHASLATFVKVANALGCGVDTLLSETLTVRRPAYDEQLAMLVDDCSIEELKIIIGTVRGLKEQIRAAKIDGGTR
jgi:transcriptional regulator with XRE-family HTH domain